MSLNVKVTPTILIVDNDAADTRFSRTATEQNYTVDGALSGREVLPAAGSLTFSLGTMTNVIGCWVEVDQNVTLVINGQNVSLTIPQGGTFARFNLDGHITALSIVYAGSDPCNIVWAVWGDPVEVSA